MNSQSRVAPDDGERVICVDEDNQSTGEGEKLEVHRAGLLHRAFSVFLFDAKGRLLLQRRADGKYHAGGMWANSCCGHPRPGEETAPAAVRRVREELGVSVTLKELYQFRYCTPLDNGLIENELVHFLFGRHCGGTSPDLCEVSETEWHALEDIAAWDDNDTHRLAPWFKIYLEQCLPMLQAGRDLTLQS